MIWSRHVGFLMGGERLDATYSSWLSSLGVSFATDLMLLTVDFSARLGGLVRSLVATSLVRRCFACGRPIRVSYVFRRLLGLVLKIVWSCNRAPDSVLGFSRLALSGHAVQPCVSTRFLAC